MTKQKQQKIPEFKTREEMAAFWDSHDVADFLDELEPVKLKVAKNLTNTLNVRIDIQDLEKLREEAETKGIGPSTLARMWIKERLYGHQ
jgi:predicted DNA binding CopG/RHH family protein